MQAVATAEQKTIGEYNYVVTKLLAREGVRLAARVGAMIAPALDKITGAPSLEVGLAAAFKDILLQDHLAEQLEALINSMAQITTVHWIAEDGSEKALALKPQFLDSHFQDRYDALLEWLVFALTANLRSFFNGASGLGTLLRSQKPTPIASSSLSPQPVERTG